MTTLLVLWLAATVTLAVLLGVIVLVQLVWPGQRAAASRTARPADGLQLQGEALRSAA